jgi:hypothetical protein
MASTKLIPYWVRLREFQEPDKEWDQTRLQAHEPEFPFNNLADYFHDFLQQYTDEEDVYVDRDERKTFTVQNPVKRNGNTIEGHFKSGEYGENADFWDVEKHTRIKDARQENHAKEVPYYFLFHIPDHDSTQALLILSKYKRKGIKTVFDQVFRPRSRDIKTGAAYMDIEPHYSDKVLEEINEADSIASLKFRGKDLVPAREQYADRTSVERVQDEISGVIDVGTELKLTPKDNQDAFRELIRGLVPGEENPQFDYGKLETENFDTANVTVVEGESQLTFSLWKEQIQMRMDVNPDEYDLDVYGGYPTPYSLGCVARQLANDLMSDFDTDIGTESLIPRSVGIPENEAKQPAPVED